MSFHLPLWEAAPAVQKYFLQPVSNASEDHRNTALGSLNREPERGFST
jgi:hypothetical protein